jgi:predicted transcriptional regulator
MNRLPHPKVVLGTVVIAAILLGNVSQPISLQATGMNGNGSEDDSDSAGFSYPSLCASMGIISLTTELLRRGRRLDRETTLWVGSGQGSRRRDELGIMIDILVLAELPAFRKTILRRANLSQFQTKRYISFMVRKGLLSEELSPRRIYKTTEKGREFVRILAGI